MTRFRPSCLQLEDRRTPALNVFALGGSLLVTGTPEAVSLNRLEGWSEAVTVTRTTGDFYRLTDGPRDLGTYRVTRGITLSLDSFDNNITVDLSGGTLRGDLTIDLGTGDRDPDSFNRVTVGGGTVTGSVGFRGSRATEFQGVGWELENTTREFPDGNGGVRTVYFTSTVPLPATVRGDVSAIGREVPEPFEDTLSVGPGSTVRGSVFTQRVTYTDIRGTVNRDVTALTHVPGGMGLFVFGGVIGGDLYAEGSASEPGYLSFNILDGATIRGNATIRITDGFAVTVLANTSVGKNFVYAAEGTVDSYVFMGFETRVGRSAVFDLNTAAGTTSGLDLSGTVGGSLVVNDRDGDLAVRVGFDEGEPAGLVVRGGITVNAGGGTNSFAFDGASGSKAGGPVVYSGGTGSDTVTITGSENRFDLFVFVGGGDDTVAFAPDARVRSALIVFAPGGTNAWTPPDAIDFPLTLLGL